MKAKRLLSLFLVFVMMVGFLPIGVRANEPISEPVFNPASGSTIAEGEKIQITCDNYYQADIYYTIDGSDPDPIEYVENYGWGSTKKYDSNMISVGEDAYDIVSFVEGGSVTIKAIAAYEDGYDGWVTSDIVTATYTLSNNGGPVAQCAAPTFKVDGVAVEGTYEIPADVESVNVTIEAEDGADISYYIDDGFPQAYSTPISASAAMTITAFATKNGQDSEAAVLEITKAQPVSNEWTINVTLGKNCYSSESGKLTQSVIDGEDMVKITATPSYYYYEFTQDAVDAWMTEHPTEVTGLTLVLDGEKLSLTGKPKSDLTLTLPDATEIVYAVKFAANAPTDTNATLIDGKEPPADAPIKTGETITLPVCPWTVEGYRFGGWKIGTQSAIAAGGSYKFSKYDLDSGTHNITAKCYWIQQVTVTFDMNGADSAQIPSQTKDAGSKVTKPTAPTREGYSFVKWVDASTGTEWNFSYSYVRSDLTLRAEWAKKYDVTLDGEGTLPGGTISVDKTSAIKGEKVTITATPNAHYSVTAGGYKTSPDGQVNAGTKTTYSQYSTITFYMPEGDVIATATFTENTYFTVTLHANGGTGEDIVSNHIYTTSFNTGTIKTDNQFSAVSGWTSTTGSVLIGWTTDPDVKTPVTSVARPTQSGSNVDLYALWGYTVTFNADGGTPEPTAQQVVNGETATEPAAPTKDGVMFGGWYVFDGEAMDDVPFSFGTPITSDLVLKAKWLTDFHTVTYAAGEGAEGSKPADQVREGETFIAPANLKADGKTPYFTKTGYTFDGWTVRDGDGTLYKAGDPITLTDDVTLVAHWQIESYAVTFDLNGVTCTAEAPEAQTVEYNAYATKPTDDPTQAEGQSEKLFFTGWFEKNANGNLKETPFDFENTPITGAITLYAGWTDRDPSLTWYKVTFKPMLGTYGTYEFKVNGVSYTNAKPYTAWVTADNQVTDPLTLDGTSLKNGSQKFVDWYELNAAGTAVDTAKRFDFTKPINSDVTLGAKWAYTVYEVAFYNEITAATPVKMLNVASSSKVLANEIPTPVPPEEGCTFQGWYAQKMDYVAGKYERVFEADGVTPKLENQAFDFDNYISKSSYFYAIWSYPDKCTVTYDAGADGSGEFGVAGEDKPLKTLAVQVIKGSYAVRPVLDEAILLAPGKTATFHSQCGDEGVFKNQHWRFLGWYQVIDGKVSDKPFDFENTQVTEDITVKALWQRYVEVRFITKNVNRPYAVVPVDLNTAMDPNNMPADPVQEGYRFEGWFRKDGAGTMYDEPFDFANTKITTNMLDRSGVDTLDSFTVYAKFTNGWNVDFMLGENEALTVNGTLYMGNEYYPDRYRVEVEAGKTAVDPSKVAGNKIEKYLSYDYTTPENSVLDPDAVFLGWYEKNEDGSFAANAFDFSTPITRNVVLWAKWGEAAKPSIEVSVRNTTLTFSVKNAPTNAMAIVSWYDANGRLLGTKIVNVNEGDTANQTVTIDGRAVTCKVMLVNRTTFVPLCAAKSIA